MHLTTKIEGVKYPSTAESHKYTVTAQDVTDTVATLSGEGLELYGVVINISRAGVLLGGGTIALSGQDLTVADGGAYTLTAGDEIHAITFGGAVL